ncbi:site-specific integrase [Escherichia coli]|uniref:site-specific integrase n=1 Tax=Enterobacteriaceae TaxID=543 RepID=UPI0021D27810|nr:site-specific integrase [Escherichia coli]ELK0606319.1 site-specific integrase [Escherichia coli]ELK0619319.1 site-specific integrase [Escherichia coli]ELK0645923.1 site-specific integrase [Escherichia coli]MCU6363071.1 site-specific integrase [Escherichia coli]HCY2309200.1 site-specific integrase [Escherichia coli]
MLNSKTYLYQRNGVFYIRLRMKSTDRLTVSHPSHSRYKIASVSLRTKDRRTAMAYSRQIKAALRAIHADRPNASYEEMREHLRDIAEWELSTGRSDLFEPDMRDLYRDQYGEVGENLVHALASEPLTIDQHRYINEALNVLKACMKRIEAGDSQPLIDYIDGFDAAAGANGQASATLSVSAPQKTSITEGKHCVTVASLFEQYEQENAQNWKPATLRENKASHAALIEVFDYLGLNADANVLARADMLRVRDILQQLPKNRKQRFKDVPLVDLLGREDKTDCLDIVTINNKYLIKMAAAITGARLNEIAQLQVKDVRTTEAGTVYIHINEDDSSLPGKSIKNAHSDRCVPLVDGAYGFILADFMRLVETRRGADGDDAMVFDGLRLMKNGYGEQVSKWFNRTLLPKVLADRSGLAFHSFRHTVATQLKQHGVELAYAQAIMGHSSGSITYDRYAKEVEVDRLVNVITDIYKDTK